MSDIEWCRVQQEIMARIVCEMRDRQQHNPTGQSQLNPGQRLSDRIADTSSLASDDQTADDPVIGQ